LKRRLEGRKTEDAATIQKRLDRVQLELELGKQFEHQIVNDRLQTAIDDVQMIVSKHLQH
jgi:guanylate kinase